MLWGFARKGEYYRAENCHEVAVDLYVFHLLNIKTRYNIGSKEVFTRGNLFSEHPFYSADSLGMNHRHKNVFLIRQEYLRK